MILLKLYLPFNHHEIAEKVSQSLDLYLCTAGDGKNILHEGCDEDREYFSLTPSGWEQVRAELAPPWNGEWFLDDLEDKQERDFYLKRQCERFVHLTGGDSSASGYEFSYTARLPWRQQTRTDEESSVVSFCWPTEHLEERGPGDMRELLVRLASQFPFSSGHAGLAFRLPTVTSQPVDLKALLRHPGVDVPHGLTSLGHQVDGVHWLNFLGPPVLGALGGSTSLRISLHAPSVSVQDVGNSQALVTLGRWPEAGDLEQKQELPAYREFARVLKPWLYECPPYYSLRGYSHEETLSWWHRFLY